MVIDYQFGVLSVFGLLLSNNPNNSTWLGIEPSALHSLSLDSGPLHHSLRLQPGPWRDGSGNPVGGCQRPAAPHQHCQFKTHAHVHAHAHGHVTNMLFSFIPEEVRGSILPHSSKILSPLVSALSSMRPTPPHPSTRSPPTQEVPLCCPPPLSFLPLWEDRKEKKTLSLSILWPSSSHIPASSSFTKCVAYMTRLGPVPPPDSHRTPSPPPRTSQPTAGALKRLVWGWAIELN